jgi:hypothetical protein
MTSGATDEQTSVLTGSRLAPWAFLANICRHYYPFAYTANKFVSGAVVGGAPMLVVGALVLALGQ